MLSVIGSIFARADGNADGVLNLVEYWGTYRAFDMDRKSILYLIPSGFPSTCRLTSFQANLYLTDNGEITMDEYVETISQMPALKSMGSEHEVDAVSRRLFLAGDMNDNNLLDEGDANIIFFNLDKDGQFATIFQPWYWQQCTKCISQS